MFLYLSGLLFTGSLQFKGTFLLVGTIENAGGRRDGSSREKGEVPPCLVAHPPTFSGDRPHWPREPGTGYRCSKYHVWALLKELRHALYVLFCIFFPQLWLTLLAQLTVRLPSKHFSIYCLPERCNWYDKKDKLIVIEYITYVIRQILQSSLQ